MIYEKQQKKMHLSLCAKIYTSAPTQPYTPTRSDLRPNNPAERLRPHKYRRVTQRSNGTGKQRNTRMKIRNEKPIWTNGNNTKPPHDRT
jgi:hypothetical protein